MTQLNKNLKRGQKLVTNVGKHSESMNVLFHRDRDFVMMMIMTGHFQVILGQWGDSRKINLEFKKSNRKTCEIDMSDI